MSRHSYLFTGLIAAFSLIWVSTTLHAQSVTVQISEETSVTLGIEEYHDFHITVTNNSIGPLSFYVLRSVNNLPDDGWMSTICMDDYCYSGGTSQTDLVTVQAGSVYHVKFTVYTGKVENTVGNFELKFIAGGLSGGNELETITFSAQAKTSSSVPTIAEPAHLPYPNPAVAGVTIPLTAVKNAHRVEIFNVTGTQVAVFEGASLNANDIRLNLADFAAGLYYYTIAGSDETRSGSFSVAK